MGYTHYMTQEKDYTPEEWAQVSEDIGAILSYVYNEQGIAIRGWDGTGQPNFTEARIAFNGAGDTACETFSLESVRTPCEYGGALGANFCKTNRQPYDLAVTACLCYLATIAESHHVESDGDGSDYVQGLELARQALPRYANRIDIPHPVMARDRWVAPWFALHTEDYDFNLCVDGYAYITGPKGRSYRFYSHHEAVQWALTHTEKPIKVESRWGSGMEGGKCLFNASGAFTPARTKALGLQQRRVLKAMLDMAEGDRAIPPPAFIRPGEMPVMDNSTRARSFEDLLKMATA